MPTTVIQGVQMKKILLSIASLFAITMLVGCGGGGGGGSGFGISPIPDEVYNTDGSMKMSGLKSYYSGLYGATETVDNTTNEMILFQAGQTFDSENDMEALEDYEAIRGSLNGQNAPSFVSYSRNTNGGPANTNIVIGLGSKIADNTNIRVEVRAPTLTVDYQFVNLAQGISVVNSGYEKIFNSHYDFNAYEFTYSGEKHYTYILAGNYAALALVHESDYEYESGDELNDRIEPSHYFVGILTNELPTVNANYTINEIIGSRENEKDNEWNLLVGGGSLEANFASGNVNLDLDVDYIDGSDYAVVNIDNLKVGDNNDSASLYHFYINSGTTGSIDFSDTGLTDLGIDDIVVGGSFYGPNGEEVAGGLACSDYSSVCDSNDDNDINLTFIGKKD